MQTARRTKGFYANIPHQRRSVPLQCYIGLTSAYAPIFIVFPRRIVMQESTLDLVSSLERPDLDRRYCVIQVVQCCRHCVNCKSCPL